jgi:hypothetical protein
MLKKDCLREFFLKMNSMSDHDLIDKLYEAGKYGGADQVDHQRDLLTHSTNGGASAKILKQ